MLRKSKIELPQLDLGADFGLMIILNSYSVKFYCFVSMQSAQTTLMHEHHILWFHNTTFVNGLRKARREEAAQLPLHRYYSANRKNFYSTSHYHSSITLFPEKTFYSKSYYHSTIILFWGKTSSFESYCLLPLSGY